MTNNIWLYCAIEKAIWVSEYKEKLRLVQTRTRTKHGCLGIISTSCTDFWSTLQTDHQLLLSLHRPFWHVCVWGSWGLSAFPYALIKSSQQERASVQISDVMHTHTQKLRKIILKHTHIQKWHACTRLIWDTYEVHKSTHTFNLTSVCRFLLALDQTSLNFAHLKETFVVLFVYVHTF